MTLPALQGGDEAILGLVAEGDLSRLSAEQKTRYYIMRCQSVGLDPAAQPFEYLRLSGKLVLYAKKGAAEQLNRLHQISHERLSAEQVGDIYEVWMRAKDVGGRFTDECGSVSTKGLTGENLCNARMKATTKAKRRATLAHTGLGMLDESELDTVRGAQVGDAPVIAMPRRKSEATEPPPAVAIDPPAPEPESQEPAPESRLLTKQEIKDLLKVLTKHGIKVADLQTWLAEHHHITSSSQICEAHLPAIMAWVKTEYGKGDDDHAA